MKRVIVRCPICKTQKNELVTDDLIELRKSINKGIVLIGLSKGRVCEHDIYLEIDKNFSIRNTYSAEDAKKFKKEDYPHLLNLETY